MKISRISRISCCCRLACAVLVAITMPAQALVVRAYNDTDHKRFDPFPTSPQINTSSIYSAVDLTGVGFKANTDYTTQCTLISRQHVVYARHIALIQNSTVRFVNASNGVVDRTTGLPIKIQEAGVDSDLVIYQLNAPIDAGSGISPMPYFDGDPVGQGIGVLGVDNTSVDTADRWLVMGTGEIGSVQTDLFDVNDAGQILTKVYRFDYNTSPGPKDKTDDDCYLEPGDSGNPSFVPVSGKAALIGTHTAVAQQLIGFERPNYDTLVPHYITQLDAVLNPMGYRMAPVSAAPTTLATTTSTTQLTPRKAMPLDYVYQVENTGAELTGNVEVEFLFDPAEAPASISGPAGWVAYGSGSKWTLRKATLVAAEMTSVTAHWLAAPSVSTLSFTVTRRSDTTVDDVTAVDLSLAESYADWAAGLVDGGLTSDPEGDGVVNLLEYAFGGDPELASRVIADGSPLTGSIDENAGTVTFSYPEREDLAARGLNYTLEFSNDLTSWLEPPPPGFSSSTAAFDPDIAGFLKRSCTWPSGGAAPLFLRVGVDLSE